MWSSSVFPAGMLAVASRGEKIGALGAGSFARVMGMRGGG
ncbi:MAG: hypothetical protein OJF49_004589 [Ktedonobacterales bacterium]|nr:MAG: hypothetical protein OJF49_004589 [Ktedonobacterales bacterium]